MEENGHNETDNLFSCSFENLGTVNKNQVTLKNKGKELILTFSYSTIISFEFYGEEYNKETRVNIWSTTTGKLLNECEPDKEKRLSEGDFKRALNKAFTELNF